MRRNPALSAGDLQREHDKALRAPLIIVVACFGYAAAWKTGDAAYDPEVKKSLGLATDDHLVAFIYAGGGLGALFAPGKAASLQDAMLEFPG